MRALTSATCSLICWPRTTGVLGNVAIWSRARVSCSAASTSADRASDRCPALPQRPAAFSIRPASVQCRANNSGRLSALSANSLSMVWAMGACGAHALLASVVSQPGAELRPALDRLIAAGLLFRRGVPPHVTYLFKHALVQDAAYGTLLREPR